MTQLEDLSRDPFHVCHVCETRYTVEYVEFWGAYPLCCPVCAAPMRGTYSGIGRGEAIGLLISLGGGPCSDNRDTFIEFQILHHVRTVADIDALLDEIRAAYSLLDLRRQRRARELTEELATGAAIEAAVSARRREELRYEAAKRAAEDRVCAQIDAGALEWRLGDLRAQAVALLRAEHEHHQYVRGVRGGALSCGDGIAGVRDIGESASTAES